MIRHVILHVISPYLKKELQTIRLLIIRNNKSIGVYKKKKEKEFFSNYFEKDFQQTLSSHSNNTTETV